MNTQTFLITAAGGNGTAIRVLGHALSRAEYAEQGKQLGKDFDPFGAEQAGFLIPSENHFEMGGGEFCGNATRAVGALLSEMKGLSEVAYTVSGFSGTVRATVRKTGEKTYDVEAVLPGLPTKTTEVQLLGGEQATIVDLGGIVQVVIEGDLPSDYKAAHRAVMDELRLSGREAVGVTWYTRKGGTAVMHPIVWVRDVDTFYYEQSCGSGTIAVAKVTGLRSIIQPTGKSIEAVITGESVTLRSEMEVTLERHD